MNELKHIPDLEFVEEIAEGGQGRVLRVRKDGQDAVLKIYHPQNATPEQCEVIRQLIQSGPPQRLAGRFAWPMELIKAADGSFMGYLMSLIDTDKYISFDDIEEQRCPHPGFSVIIEACRQLAECFRALHILGYCYSDISKDNFMFSPVTGDVIICDNDNVVVDKSGMGSAAGTPEYMAPEVVRMETEPSTVTDQHSLAVLLHILLCGGNPLHGKMEHDIHVLDGAASEYLYGTEPVFIFDPGDERNRLPDEDGYQHVAVYWNILPIAIQEMFIRAFTTGLREPSARVTAAEWIEALAQLEGQLHTCSCLAENFWDAALRDSQYCWNGGCLLDFPMKLYACGNTETAMLVTPGRSLSTAWLGDKDDPAVFAVTELHPSDADLVLLRNKTENDWNASLNGHYVSVPPDRAIALQNGIRINTGAHEFVAYP